MQVCDTMQVFAIGGFIRYRQSFRLTDERRAMKRFSAPCVKKPKQLKEFEHEQQSLWQFNGRWNR